MKFRQLEYFIEVVDCGSISTAAKKLYISQPSLSRIIGALEKEMVNLCCGVLPVVLNQPLWVSKCIIMPIPLEISCLCWNA